MRRLLAIFAVMFSQSCLAGDPVPENLMKATYLYNFAVFTEWPQRSGDTFNLCVLGQDSYGQAMGSIEGKNVNGQRLTVIRLTSLSAIRSCHMLFITEQFMPNMKKIQEELGDAPVLTVTDTATQHQPGAMIVIELENRRLTFEINAEQARRSQLNISSKILQLARKPH